MQLSFSRPLAITLVGILGMGFFPIAEARVAWVDANRYTNSSYCPDVCQVTKHFRPEVPKYNLLYAVPSGIHSHENVKKTFYVCAANHRRFGPHIGYNIAHGGNKCHVADLGKGKSSYGHYHCLCSDILVEPIKQD